MEQDREFRDSVTTDLMATLFRQKLIRSYDPPQRENLFLPQTHP